VPNSFYVALEKKGAIKSLQAFMRLVSIKVPVTGNGHLFF